MSAPNPNPNPDPDDPNDADSNATPDDDLPESSSHTNFGLDASHPDSEAATLSSLLSGPTDIAALMEVFPFLEFVEEGDFGDFSVDSDDDIDGPSWVIPDGDYTPEVGSETQEFELDLRSVAPQSLTSGLVSVAAPASEFCMALGLPWIITVLNDAKLDRPFWGVECCCSGYRVRAHWSARILGEDGEPLAGFGLESCAWNYEGYGQEGELSENSSWGFTDIFFPEEVFSSASGPTRVQMTFTIESFAKASEILEANRMAVEGLLGGSSSSDEGEGVLPMTETVALSIPADRPNSKQLYQKELICKSLPFSLTIEFFPNGSSDPTKVAIGLYRGLRTHLVDANYIVRTVSFSETELDTDTEGIPIEVSERTEGTDMKWEEVASVNPMQDWNIEIEVTIFQIVEKDMVEVVGEEKDDDEEEEGEDGEEDEEKDESVRVVVLDDDGSADSEEDGVCDSDKDEELGEIDEDF